MVYVKQSPGSEEALKDNVIEFKKITAAVGGDQAGKDRLTKSGDFIAAKAKPSPSELTPKRRKNCASDDHVDDAEPNGTARKVLRC